MYKERRRTGLNKEEIKSFTLRVSQSNPTELVVVTYDIILKYIEDAKKTAAKIREASSSFLGDVHTFLGTSDELIALRGELEASCKGAVRFIADLMSALDMQYEISSSLWRLYEFAQMRIIRAQYSYSEKELADAEDVFLALRSSFDKISKDDKSNSVMQNTQSVFAGLTYSKGKLDEISIDPHQSNRGFLA